MSEPAALSDASASSEGPACACVSRAGKRLWAYAAAASASTASCTAAIRPRFSSARVSKNTVAPSTSRPSSPSASSPSKRPMPPLRRSLRPRPGRKVDVPRPRMGARSPLIAYCPSQPAQLPTVSRPEIVASGP